jgi:Mn-dependent DtxR family transcriptional regulator
MKPTALPADVRRFLLGAVASVPHLEALLLLRGEPGRDWARAEVAQRLFVAEERVTAILADLQQQSLVAEPSPGSFRYAPSDEAKRATVDRLAEVYSRHLVEVTGLLHAKLERQALEFSDAFRLRKEP